MLVLSISVLVCTQAIDSWSVEWPVHVNHCICMMWCFLFVLFWYLFLSNIHSFSGTSLFVFDIYFLLCFSLYQNLCPKYSLQFCRIIQGQENGKTKSKKITLIRRYVVKSINDGQENHSNKVLGPVLTCGSESLCWLLTSKVRPQIASWQKQNPKQIRWWNEHEYIGTVCHCSFLGVTVYPDVPELALLPSLPF